MAVSFDWSGKHSARRSSRRNKLLWLFRQLVGVFLDCHLIAAGQRSIDVGWRLPHCLAEGGGVGNARCRCYTRLHRLLERRRVRNAGRRRRTLRQIGDNRRNAWCRVSRWLNRSRTKSGRHIRRIDLDCGVGIDRSIRRRICRCCRTASER